MELRRGLFGIREQEFRAEMQRRCEAHDRELATRARVLRNWRTLNAESALYLALLEEERDALKTAQQQLLAEIAGRITDRQAAGRQAPGAGELAAALAGPRHAIDQCKEAKGQLLAQVVRSIRPFLVTDPETPNH